MSDPPAARAAMEGGTLLDGCGAESAASQSGGGDEAAGAAADAEDDADAARAGAGRHAGAGRRRDAASSARAAALAEARARAADIRGKRGGGRVQRTLQTPSKATPTGPRHPKAAGRALRVRARAAAINTHNNNYSAE